MTNTKKIVLGVVALAVVIAGVAIYRTLPTSLGGNVEFSKKSFIEGFFAGEDRQFEVDRDGIIHTGGTDIKGVTVALSATSSVPGIITNPFGTATSTLIACGVKVTRNGIAATQNIYISTTTATGSYGSSTPAILAGFTTGTGQFTAPCQLNSATSTAGATNTWGTKADLLPGMTNEGVSRYFIAGDQNLTLRIATETPRTLDDYWVGSFWAVFMKE